MGVTYLGFYAAAQVPPLRSYLEKMLRRKIAAQCVPIADVPPIPVTLGMEVVFPTFRLHWVCGEEAVGGSVRLQRLPPGRTDVVAATVVAVDVLDVASHGLRPDCA